MSLIKSKPTAEAGSLLGAKRCGGPSKGRAFTPLKALLGGALLSAVASGLCCLGPLLYLVFGLSAAGLTGLGRLYRLRVPLAALSLLLVGYGFWNLYFSSKPLCGGWFSLSKTRLLYWLSVPVILFFVLYPAVLPLMLAQRAD